MRSALLELSACSVRMRWHERMHDDPAHRWLRELVQRAYGEVAGGGSDEECGEEAADARAAPPTARRRSAR